MEDRSALVENGTFTTKLIAILQQIFSRYKSDGADGLTQIEASRLWYQCGLRLSSLNEILGDPRCVDGKNIISFEDFHRLLQRIIADDGRRYPIDLPEDKNEIMDFKVRICNDNGLAKTILCSLSLTPFFFAIRSEKRLSL